MPAWLWVGPAPRGSFRKAHESEARTACEGLRLHLYGAGGHAAAGANVWPEHEVGAGGSEAPSKLARRSKQWSHLLQGARVPANVHFFGQRLTSASPGPGSVPCHVGHQAMIGAVGDHPGDPAPLGEEGAEVTPAGKSVLLHVVHLHSLAG